MIDFVFNNSTRGKVPNKDFFGEITETVLKVLKPAAENIGFSLNLVNRRRMRSINRKFLNRDRATDVLSSPLLKAAAVKKISHGIIELGDIFICPAEAYRKNYPAAIEELGTQTERSARILAFLTVHGLMHLLGYHHENSSQAAKELKRQERILRIFYEKHSASHGH